MTLEQEQQAADLGAFLEYCIGFALNSDTVFMQFIEQIRQIGPEHVILSTDLGQPNNPSHAEGLRTFVERAKVVGNTQAEIDTMLKNQSGHFSGLVAIISFAVHRKVPSLSHAD